MNPRAKNILTISVHDYLGFDKDKQTKMVKHVEQQIESNDKGLKHIGFGLDNDMVTAGKVFLRWTKINSFKTCEN